MSPAHAGTTSELVDVGGKKLPLAAVQSLKPRHGVLLADWNAADQLGRVRSLGVVRGVDRGASGAQIDWQESDISLRPNPAGRRWWTQQKPFFAFAPDVVARYGLDDLFAEHFPEFSDLVFGPPPKVNFERDRPSPSPIGGYVNVIRSPHGFKIGKTVNLKQRTKLFEVKLPFSDVYYTKERTFQGRLAPWSAPSFL